MDAPRTPGARPAVNNASISPVSIHSRSTEKKPHVAIVGAGFAGLRCADVLTQSGAQVTIFEARDRVGGRVHQIKNDGHLLDLGANWIHGAPGNPVARLAERTKTVLAEPDEECAMIDEFGHNIAPAYAADLNAMVWKVIDKAFKHSKEHHDAIDPGISLMAYLREEFHEMYPDSLDLFEDVEATARFWGFYVGGPIERQSLRCFALEETVDGENVFVASTYAGILHELAAQALKGATLMLNTEVTGIRYRDFGLREEPVWVCLEDGTKQAFDEVVITCPLGWLKRNTDSFYPPLPPKLFRSIQNINYGNLEKLMVSFPSAFWLEGKNCSLEPKVAPSRTPMITTFLSPRYHPDPAARSSSHWNQNFVSLAHLPGSTAHPTMLCYLYGECARHLTQLIRPHERGSNEYNDVLAMFFNPFLHMLPNYSASDPRCVPTAFCLSDWQNDRHAGFGSYSNFTVGLEEGEQDIETMRNAAGISKEGRGLWFAGEHTAPFIAMGTTNGAYMSGEFAADGIKQLYGLAVDPTDGDECEQ